MFDYTTHLVTLNVTPNYQATSEDTGKTCEWWCGLASFRVEVTYHEEFAAGKFLYGQPATVDTDSDVPAKLFARWTREGKIV